MTYNDIRLHPEYIRARAPMRLPRGLQTYQVYHGSRPFIKVDVYGQHNPEVAIARTLRRIGAPYSTYSWRPL